MTTQNQGTVALILRDSQGNFYAVPKKVLEQHRIPPEKAAGLEQALGDVSGFSYQTTPWPQPMGLGLLNVANPNSTSTGLPSDATVTVLPSDDSQLWGSDSN